MSFVFNLTNRCNLKCKTCLRGESANKDLDVSTIKLLIPDLKLLGLNQISLTGGEVILHPEFHQIVPLFALNSFRIGIVTNGSTTDKYLKILNSFKNQIDFITVSIDGYRKETHDSIRVNGSFEKANDAISIYRDNGYRVNVSYCLNALNYKELEEYIGFYAKIVNSVNILGIISTESNKDILLNEDQINECHSVLHRMRTKYKNIHTTTSSGFRIHGVDFCRAMDSILHGLAVNYNGDIMFCCDTTYDGASIGNVREMRFADILKRFYQISADLKKKRVDMYFNGQIGLKMNTCEFCNQFLTKDQRKVE